jgi:hypothetical protein
MSGGQVFGIIIGIALGVGLAIVGVIMWRRYDVSSTVRSLWQSYQSNRRTRNDAGSLDNVSVSSSAQLTLPASGVSYGSEVYSANYINYKYNDIFDSNI